MDERLSGVLAGKVALVTGGSRGIGLGIARGLADAGASLMLVGRGADALAAAAADLRGTAPHVETLATDVSDIAALPDMVATTVARLGRLDILVNDAGTVRRQPSLDVTEADWDAVLGLNLKAVFFACQAAARVMIPQGGGKIINLASMSSVLGPAGATSYAASKGGVVQVTKSLAVEWAPHNIQVNAVGPGWFATDLTAPLWADAARQQAIVARIPQGRLGAPRDVAGAAVFLASPMSDYITGQVLYVDGGYLSA